MNPRIVKEIRTQAPVLGLIALCAGIMTAAWRVESPYTFINAPPVLTGVYFVCSLLMAAMAFGNEFHLRTMSLLLSQPVERRKLWPEKMRVLLTTNALGALVTFAAVICTLPVGFKAVHDETLDLCVIVFVSLLFCCTAPYFTLVSKSTLGGIVFTVFGCGMLFALSSAIWDQLSVLHNIGKLKDKLTAGELDGPSFVFVILSIPYSGFLYWLGRRRFLQLEVIDSQSLEANLPQGLETALANFSAKFKSPFARLLFKELRLQRISLMLTAAFCIFMAFERLTWNANNERTFVVAGTLAIYLFLFPVIVCATAVAEEKTWGMKDWHLTLPPSLSRQWRVKWLIAFTLSIVLGAGLTWLLACSGPWHKDIGLDWQHEMLCYPLLIAVALYVGSISTSTIRALLLTFSLIAAYFVIIGSASGILTSFRDEPAYVSPVFLIFYIMVQIYSLVLRVLSALLVWPVYLVTPSHEKAAALARWMDFSTNHLQILFLGLYVAGFFWLILRFARTNYRHSDLVKGKVARQVVIVLAAAVFLAVVVSGAKHIWNIPLM